MRLVFSKKNGLHQFVNLLRDFYKESYVMYKDGISIIEFSVADVKRSDFVKTILSVYEKKT